MKVLVTGSSGFIGYHVAKTLLEAGHSVHGYDAMTDYYDVSLKQARLDQLLAYPNFVNTQAFLEDTVALSTAADACQPEVIIHLAAQAGVRHSIENPRKYIESNIIGTFNILEIAKDHDVKHLLLASTSSVYGANTEMPYRETDKADTPMSIYAATKKSTEALAHSWAHIHGIPTTAFRFFTVYGPWGRPDMAPSKFTQAILNDEPIDIYNNGELYRDFTYIDDLVKGIVRLIEAVPGDDPVGDNDSKSTVAPFRVVNIGNSVKISLMEFIEAFEEAIGKKAIRNYMPMQAGDVYATWADTSLIGDLTSHRPNTDLRHGVTAFVNWFQAYNRR